MRAGVFVFALLIAGCVSAPGLWHRQADGLRVDSSPEILTQFNRDRVICDGKAAESALQSRERSAFVHSRNVNLVFDACLTERGYERK